MHNSKSNTIDIIQNIANSRYLWLLFFFTSAIIFSPLFLHFDFILANSDNVYNHYPNIIYGYRALRQGHFELWNPYIFLGEDFTGSMHNHMLNPFNWILLIFPEKYLLQGITFIQFTEIALIGLFAFKVFNRYITDRSAALLPALVTQLSGFTWFTITTFIGVELFLLSIIFIYLITTAYARSHLVTFITMSLCSYGIFATGHVGYIAAFFIPIAATLAIHHKDNLCTPWKGIIGIFCIAILAGLILAAYRLIPILQTLHNSPAFWLESLSGNNAYFILPGIIPGVLGFGMGESARIFSTISDAGRHIQIHNFIYYGLPTLFLTIMALFNVFGRKGLFIALLALSLVCTQVFLIQPIADIIAIVLYPFIHAIVPRVAATFAFFAASGIITYCIHKNEYRITSGSLRFLLAFIGLSLCITIAYSLKALHGVEGQFAHLAHWFWPIFWANKIILTVIFIGSLTLAWYLPLELKISRTLTNAAILIFCATTVAWLLLNFKHPFLDAPSVKILLFLIGNLIWSILITIILRTPHKPINNSKYLVSILFLSSIALLIFTYPENINENWHHPSYLLKLVSLKSLALCSFLVSAFLCMELLIRRYKDAITSREFLLITLAFLFGNLLFSLKLYSYSGGCTFSSEQLYPPTRTTTLPDTDQFRVTHSSNHFTLTPWTKAEPYTNVFMVDKLRTYAGVDSYFDEGLKRLIDTFYVATPPAVTRSGISPSIENERLLDLFGVKYDLSKNQIRPHALARIAFFANYLVISTPAENNKILTNPHFHIDSTVLLNINPNIIMPNKKSTAATLNTTSLSTDNLKIDIKQSQPGIVMFSDLYSKNWKAYWNDDETPVLLADGYFMAIVKPQGAGILKFKYQPASFFKLVKLSATAFFVLALLSIFAFASSRLRKIKNK